jgi:hypothetical protein
MEEEHGPGVRLTADVGNQVDPLETVECNPFSIHRPIVTYGAAGGTFALVSAQLADRCESGADLTQPTCYYMSMLDRRLQVLIDEDRWCRLEQEAAERGVPVSVLVREAIDERFPGHVEERRAALQAMLDAEPMAVPEPEELREELQAIRDRRPT